MEIVKEENKETPINEFITPDELAQQEAEVTDKTEALPNQEPKEISRLTLSIEIVCYEGNRQDIAVNTPNGSTLSENIGTLEIAKAVLLRKL